MIKATQDTEVEFEYKAPFDEQYKSPSPRRLVVHFYGGSAEDCIKKARDDHKLSPDYWKLVGVKGPGSV